MTGKLPRAVAETYAELWARLLDPPPEDPDPFGRYGAVYFDNRYFDDCATHRTDHGWPALDIDPIPADIGDAVPCR